MEINRLLKMISATTLAGIMFVGCGGGSSSSTPTVLTGTFIDAQVKGLHYKTATQEGDTNENGEFKYIAGETIEFKLGNLSLGSVSADSLITPYTLAGDTDISNPSNKAINIALLLQNFDADRTDGILDVTKLKDMDLSSFKLDDTLLDMEGKISENFAKNSFVTSAGILTATLINSDTVKTNLKNNVILNTIINKDYEGVDYSELFGASKQGASFKFTNDKMAGSYQGENFEATYEIIDGILKITFSDGVEYDKIINISSNVVSVCYGDTLEEAKTSCSVPDAYWVVPSSVDKFIADNSSKKILTDKTLVTSLSEIQNKNLYQLNVLNNKLQTSKITIDSNGHYVGNFRIGDYWNATFSDGILNVTGWDQWRADNEGNGNVDDKYEVYKYNLTGKTIPARLFGNGIFEDATEIATKFPTQNFIFTGGNMYCKVLWSECWVDEDAITQMNTQANSF